MARAWTKVNPNPAPFKPEPLNGIFMQPGEILRKTLSQMTLCSTGGDTLFSSQDQVVEYLEILRKDFGNTQEMLRKGFRNTLKILRKVFGNTLKIFRKCFGNTQEML